MMMRDELRCVCICIALTIATACTPTPDPNIFYVATTGDDSNDCHTPATACLTIEAAIDKAAYGNTIFVLPGDYLETDTGVPTVGVVVDKDLTIEGVGDARVDGGGARTVMSVLPAVSVTLRNLTFHDGSGEAAGGILIGDGANVQIFDSTVRNNVAIAGVSSLGLFNAGGIHNRGTLSINNTEILFNTAELPVGSHAYGGGIYNQGILTMTDSLLAMNNSEEIAGGLYNDVGASASLVNSMVDDNYMAGGIWNGGIMSLVDTMVRANNVDDPTLFLCGGISNYGELVMTGGVVADNGSPTTFAGICNFEDTSVATISGTLILQNIGSGAVNYGTMTLEDVEISEHIKGGVFNYGTMTVSRGRVTLNYAPKGAGIWNVRGNITIQESTIAENEATMWGGGLQNNADATMLVIDSTITGNSATQKGGGLYIAGPGETTLINSTVSGNLAPEGAGIANNGEVSLIFATITDNNVHGISSVNIGVTQMLSTIIAENGTADCFGTDYLTLGHNLDSDGTCDLDVILDDLPSTPPLLGPLAANGGPSMTHALLPTSPAVNTGASGGDCPADDQRSVGRPQGIACDIGAFELEEELILPAPIETEELRPTATSTSTPKAEESPRAKAIMNANCRNGPHKDYKITGALMEGETSQIDGRNQDNTWLWILNPSAFGHCWISIATVEVLGDISRLPVVAAPPKPEPEQEGCYIYGQTTDELICVVPCPKDANPGGACTP